MSVTFTSNPVFIHGAPRVTAFPPKGFRFIVNIDDWLQCEGPHGERYLVTMNEEQDRVTKLTPYRKDDLGNWYSDSRDCLTFNTP